MRHWALQYCRHVKILTPRDLAKQVQQDLKDALKRYEKGE
jgi:predicted DNA-binding transcriptional regulator YafY